MIAEKRSSNRGTAVPCRPQTRLRTRVRPCVSVAVSAILSAPSTKSGRLTPPITPDSSMKTMRLCIDGSSWHEVGAHQRTGRGRRLGDVGGTSTYRFAPPGHTASIGFTPATRGQGPLPKGYLGWSRFWAGSTASPGLHKTRFGPYHASVGDDAVRALVLALPPSVRGPRAVVGHLQVHVRA